MQTQNNTNINPIVYRDDKGNIGVGQTVTDLSRNNEELKKFRVVLWYFASLLTIFLAIIVWLIIYVIMNGVVNNIVSRCIC